MNPKEALRRAAEIVEDETDALNKIETEYRELTVFKGAASGFDRHERIERVQAKAREARLKLMAEIAVASGYHKTIGLLFPGSVREIKP